MAESADNPEGRITVRRDGPVLLMAIDRPHKLNGFTPKMFEELARAYTALETDDDLRVGVLHGEGPHFTAGLDLPKFADMMQRGAPVIPDGLIDPFDLRAPRRQKPVLTAVRGITYTVGVELSMAADIAIAATDCRFSQIEVKRGVMATGGPTVRMVERAGWGHAMRWLLTGDEFDAETALRMNIVTQIVAPDQVLPTALEVARRIARAAPQAVMATRRNALLALEQGRHAAIAEFDRVNRALSQTDDAREGIAAFKDKREPDFTGK